MTDYDKWFRAGTTEEGNFFISDELDEKHLKEGYERLCDTCIFDGNCYAIPDFFGYDDKANPIVVGCKCYVKGDKQYRKELEKRVFGKETEE